MGGSRGSEPAGWARQVGADPTGRSPTSASATRTRVVGVDDVGGRRPRALGAKCPDVNLEIVEPGPEPTRSRCAVHERGAGITEACGTGACAAAWAAARWGLGHAGDGRTRGAHGRWTCKVTLDDPRRRRVTAHRSGDLRRHRRAPSSHRSTSRQASGPVTSPVHDEALGDTLIERSIRERIVLVGVTPPAPTRRHRGQPRRAGRCSSTRPAPTTWPRPAPRDAPTRDLHRQGQGRGARELCLAVDADTVVFDNELTPAQQFNLEKLLGRTAIDRTAVILDIFAQNAHTLEGKAQVELALLRYRLPRLRGRPASLSQQAGGIGARFGPGETQLEVDRRRIMRRITPRARPEASSPRTRQLQRKSRRPAAASPRSPSSATRTPASRRCSTASPRPACSSRTACSPRSTRPPAASPCPAASRCCSPTPSASSAACPTARRGVQEHARGGGRGRPARPRRRRQRGRPGGQIDAVRAVLGEIGAGRGARAARVQQGRPRARGGQRQVVAATRARSRSRPSPARASTTCSCSATGCGRSPAVVELLVPYDRGDVLAASTARARWCRRHDDGDARPARLSDGRRSGAWPSSS